MATPNVPSLYATRCFEVSATIGATLLITGLVLVALGQWRFGDVAAIKRPLVLVGTGMVTVGGLSAALALGLFLKLTGR